MPIPAKVGEVVGGVPIRDIAELPEIVQEHGIAIGVICTPAPAVQQVADLLIAAGIRSILNFAPIVINVPPGVSVRKVDLAIELQILAFYEQRKATLAEVKRRGRGGGRPGADRGRGPALGLLGDRDLQQDVDRDDHEREQDELERTLIEQRDLGRLRERRSRSVPPRGPHAGPYHGGASPPVRISLRFFSARSSSGRVSRNRTIDPTRNMIE